MKAEALAWLHPSGVAAGTALALRNASAAARHFVWTMAIACALSMPLLSVCLPQWRVLPGWIAREPAAAVTRSRTVIGRPLAALPDVRMEQPVQDQGARSIPGPRVAPPTSGRETDAFVPPAPRTIQLETSRGALLVFG